MSPCPAAVRELVLGVAPLLSETETRSQYQPLCAYLASAAPDISPELRQVLRQALLNAHKTDAGRAMLTRIGLERFDPANATVYAGQGRIL